MKKHTALTALAALALSLASNALAAEEGGHATHEMNNTKGFWRVGGSFELAHESETSPAGDKTSATRTSTTALGEYFFIDHLSVGAEVALATLSETKPSFFVGPRATYHFYECGQFSAYVALQSLFGVGYASSGITQLSGNLGTEYFFTPSVAFGPSFFYRHLTSSIQGTSDTTTLNQYGLEASFAIYL